MGEFGHLVEGEVGQLCLEDTRHEQYGVSTDPARRFNLDGVDEDVLHQDREGDGLLRPGEVLDAPLEVLWFGEDGDCRRAPALESCGDLGHVAMRAEITLRGRPKLHLGDDWN